MIELFAWIFGDGHSGCCDNIVLLLAFSIVWFYLEKSHSNFVKKNIYVRFSLELEWRFLSTQFNVISLNLRTCLDYFCDIIYSSFFIHCYIFFTCETVLFSFLSQISWHFPTKCYIIYLLIASHICMLSYFLASWIFRRCFATIPHFSF